MNLGAVLPPYGNLPSNPIRCWATAEYPAARRGRVSLCVLAGSREVLLSTELSAQKTSGSVPTGTWLGPGLGCMVRC